MVLILIYLIPKDWLKKMWWPSYRSENLSLFINLDNSRKNSSQSCYHLTTSNLKLVVTHIKIFLSNNSPIVTTHQKHDVSGSDVLSQKILCTAVIVPVIIQGIISRIVVSLSRGCCYSECIYACVYILCPCLSLGHLAAYSRRGMRE